MMVVAWTAAPAVLFDGRHHRKANARVATGGFDNGHPGFEMVVFLRPPPLLVPCGL